MARSGLTVIGSLLFLLALVTAPAAAPPNAAKGKANAGQRQAVTDAAVTSVEREAVKCRAAADALDVYRDFLAGVELTPRQQKVVEGRQKVWQDRIDRKLVRLGAEWVTLDAAKATAKRADDLIDDAFAKMKAQDFKKANNLFERAAKQDPSGIRADFYLGMLNTPNFWNYAVAAEKHFGDAHRTDPGNSAIANNLAISKVKMGRYPEAIELWTDALRSVPEAPQVVHNLGRFINVANSGRIAGARASSKRASLVFEKAVAGKKGPGYNTNQGWLYAPIALPREERERAGVVAQDDDVPGDDQPGAAANRARVLVGSGTGFVIQPGYVLSNRHVAQAGTSFGILRPADKGAEHAAAVIAVSDDLDLALFRCETLAAPIVQLNGDPPRRGSEIMVLGFPFSDVLGESLKAVRGSIFGFEDDAKRRTVMYEANTNPGNSGGPVCDNTGRVIAIHFAGANLAALNRGAGKFGLGVPVECALPFLQKSLPDLATVAQGAKLEWPDIDEQISKSVVLMKLYAKTLAFARPPATEKKVVNVFEDRTCVTCKGRGKIPCPNCFKGSVTAYEAGYSIIGIGVGTQVLKFDVPKSKACSVCRGAGVVDCLHCDNGLDPALK